MSNTLEILLHRYNHVISNVPLGIYIQAKAPAPSSQVAGYVTATLVGVLGLFLAFISMTKIGLAVVIGSLIIAANVWKRGESSSVRNAFTLLIGAEEVVLTQGFRTERIPRNDVSDIYIRQRLVDGQQEAQLFFVDSNERQYESITFFGISEKGLKESAERIADHIWNFVKTEQDEHRALGPLDTLGDLEDDLDERPPWG